MCGIAGIIDLDQPDAGLRVKQMLALIRHRGPDGWGVLEPTLGVALGHVRLAVVDRAGGKQPMARGPLSAVINGQLYDYRATREELERHGVCFESRCDSELVLPLYARHGDGFVHHLRGEFALAVYDLARRQLLLARDPLGVRPLFYAISPRRMCFGSEIKALFAAGVPREMDAAGITAQLMFALPPGRTPFVGVQELRPGHLLLVRDRGGRLEAISRPWWRLPTPDPGAGAGKAAGAWNEVAQELLATVRASVECRLDSDVPIACYLSGGIDSAAVAALAKQVRGEALPALTIGFGPQPYDESGQAAGTAMAMGAPHHVCRLSGDELLGQEYEDTVWHAERVMYGTLGVARRHLASFARSLGFPVVLTGDGADELFGGYIQFERDMVLAGPDTAGGLADLHRRLGLDSPPPEEACTAPILERLWGGTPSWLQTWLWALDQLRPLLSDCVLAALQGYDPVAELAESLDGGTLRTLHPLDRGQRTWIQTMLPGYILGWSADRVEMAHGVESRPPFLDLAVVEIASRVPPDWRIRDGSVKWILRQALVGVLPEAIRTRGKRGFVAPSVRNSPAWRAFQAKWFAPDRVRAANLFDPRRLETFLAQAPAGYDAHQHEKLLHQIVCLHVMHDRFCAADLPAMAEQAAKTM